MVRVSVPNLFAILIHLIVSIFDKHHFVLEYAVYSWNVLMAMCIAKSKSTCRIFNLKHVGNLVIGDGQLIRILTVVL